MRARPLISEINRLARKEPYYNLNLHLHYLLEHIHEQSGPTNDTTIMVTILSIYVINKNVVSDIRSGVWTNGLCQLTGSEGRVLT